MTRITCLLGLVCLTCFLPAPVAAQDELRHFPADTALLVRIESIDEFERQFRVLAGEDQQMADLVWGMAQLVFTQSLGLGSETEPDLVDSSAPIYLCAPELTDLDSWAMYAKPTDKHALLRTILQLPDDAEISTEPHTGEFTAARSAETGQVIYYREIEEFILCSSSAATIAKLPADDEANFAERLQGTARQEFQSGSVGAAMNLQSIISGYADQLQAAKADFEATMRDAISDFGGKPEDLEQVQVLADLLDRLHDLEVFACGLSMDTDGVTVSGLVTVTPDSPLMQFLDDNPPGPLGELGQAPAGDEGYVAVHVKDAISQYMNSELMREHVTDETRRTVENAGLRAIFLAVSQGEDGSPMEGRAGLVAEDSQELLEALRMHDASREEQQKNEDAAVKTETSLQQAAEEYKGVAIDIQTQRKIAGPKFSDLDEEMKAVVQAQIDAGVTETRYAVIDNLMLLSDGPQERLHEFIDALQSGKGTLSTTPAYQVARNKLGAEANLMMLLDMKKVFDEMLPEAFRQPADEDEQPAEFWSQALAAHEDGIQMRMHYSGNNLRKFMRIASLGFLFGGGQGN